MNSLKKIRTLAIGVAVAMVAAAVVAPVATAQQPQLSFSTASTSYTQGSSGSLDPDTGRAEITFDWEFEISNPGYDQIGATQSSTLLVINQAGCEDSNLKVSGAKTYPVALTEDSGQPKNRDSGTAKFSVTATQQAPGETPISCTFKGKTNAVGNQVSASNEGTADTEVVVSYLGLVSASIPTTIKQAGPQKQIKYDIEVSNLGNSLSNIRFELRDAEAAASGGWNPVAPIPVVLQSESQGGTDTTKTVSFLVSTPFKNGWNNKEKTFTLDITPESTKNAEKKGAAVTVNVLARVRGVYVPSLEPIVMVGAVIGAGMVARLMRNDEE